MDARAAQTFVLFVEMIAPAGQLFLMNLPARSRARLFRQPAIEHGSP
jgi:hypothetical protein